MGVVCHYKVSLEQTGSLLYYFDQISKIPNPSTVGRGVVECHLALIYALCERMANSTDLWWCMDGAGVDKGRDFLCILIGGRKIKNSKPWWGIIEFKQLTLHTAQNEHKCLMDTLKYLQKIQVKMCVHVTKLYEFLSCVGDNAKVNTGDEGGTFILFSDERTEVWLACGFDIKDLIPFLAVGCWDHIVSLVSGAWCVTTDGMPGDMGNFTKFIKHLTARSATR